eukprot:4918485-Amphidinium_carterae.1
MLLSAGSAGNLALGSSSGRSSAKIEPLDRRLTKAMCRSVAKVLGTVVRTLQLLPNKNSVLHK